MHLLGRVGLFQGFRVELDLAIALDHLETVVERARSDVRVELPVLVAQLVNLAITLLLGGRGSLGLLLEAGADPLNRALLDFLGELLTLRKQCITGLLVFHLGVLARLGLGIFILPVLVTFQLLHDLTRGNELLQVCPVFGEVNLGGDYRVKPALDDAPDTYGDRGQNAASSGSMEVHLLEKTHGALWMRTEPRDSG